MKTFSHLKIALLASSLLLSPAAWAEETAPVTIAAEAQIAADVPWLYEGSDVPIDKSWTFGKLDNGLRYAVKNNQVPAGQVSIRVRIDAGALHEEDDEQGFAHLTSQITLNGADSPDAFSNGPNQNENGVWAKTTPTQTVYKLDISVGKGDELRNLVSFMSQSVRSVQITDSTYHDGVESVLQSIKERSDSQLTFGHKLREHMFQGQRLASRSTATIPQSKNLDKLRNFYSRWYRPDNTVVVITGDVQLSTAIDLIEKSFKNWVVESSRPVPPDFGVPKVDGKIFAKMRDPSVPNVATISYMRPWLPMVDTMAYNEQLLVDALAMQIINRRLDTLATTKSGISHAAVEQRDEARSADITFVTLRFRTRALVSSLEAVRAVIRDLIVSPPKKRELKDAISALKKAVDEHVASKHTTSSEYTERLITAVDMRETVVSPDIVQVFFDKISKNTTPEKINESVVRLFDADTIRVFVNEGENVIDSDSERSVATEIDKWSTIRKHK